MSHDNVIATVGGTLMTLAVFLILYWLVKLAAWLTRNNRPAQRAVGGDSGSGGGSDDAYQQASYGHHGSPHDHQAGPHGAAEGAHHGDGGGGHGGGSDGGGGHGSGDGGGSGGDGGGSAH